MRTVLLSVLLASAVVASVLATMCHHEDSTPCMTALNCTSADELPGCEHDRCTCVKKPQPCIIITDCTGTCDKRDEANHCVDGSCHCMKQH